MYETSTAREVKVYVYVYVFPFESSFSRLQQVAIAYRADRSFRFNIHSRILRSIVRRLPVQGHGLLLFSPWPAGGPWSGSEQALPKSNT